MNRKADLKGSNPYKLITPPVYSTQKHQSTTLSDSFIESDKIADFLESRSSIYEFEYSHKKRDDGIFLGYETKPVEKIRGIFLACASIGF